MLHVIAQTHILFNGYFTFLTVTVGNNDLTGLTGVHNTVFIGEINLPRGAVELRFQTVMLGVGVDFVNQILNGGSVRNFHGIVFSQIRIRNGFLGTGAVDDIACGAKRLTAKRLNGRACLQVAHGIACRSVRELQLIVGTVQFQACF